MLSICSCVSWPSVCLLWKNICSFFLTIFDWVICFDLELHELFVILKINPLFIALFANIFPHCVGCHFALLMFYFIFQKILSLTRFHLILFRALQETEKDILQFTSKCAACILL